ncbi:MAG: M43 family zinc metalloprotease [Spirosomataceae bacterium]
MKKLITYTLLLGFLFQGCIQEETPEPAAQFLGFGLVKRLELSLPENRVFFKTGEKVTIKPSIRAFDKDKKVISYDFLPLMNWTANAQEIEGPTLEFTSDGIKKIQASFGKLTSNDASVQLFDVNKISLKVTNTTPKNTYFNDNSILVFTAVATYDGQTLDIPISLVAVNVNTKEEVILSSGAWQLTKPGSFQIEARFRDIKSTDLVIQVKEITQKLQLDFELVGSVIRANNKSEILFKPRSFDLQDREIPLSSQARVYDNGQPFDHTKPYKTAVPGVHVFDIRLPEGLVSKEVRLNIPEPEVFPTVRIPVIIHSFGVSYTNEEVTKLFSEVNKAYKDTYRINTADVRDPSGVEVFVEFYPYDKDNQGNPLAVRGVHPINKSSSSWNQDEFIANAGQDFWDPNTVINVWVKQGTLSGIAGFAYYPVMANTNPLVGVGGFAPKGTQPNFAFGTYLMERYAKDVGVLAHELGHNLGLRHVFNGNGSNLNECRDDSDYCPDTFEYDRGKYQTNINQFGYRRERCSDGRIFISSNFMDYFINYENSFTFDQRTRVRHVISYGLWLPTPFNGVNARKKSQNLRISPTQLTGKGVLEYCGEIME